VGTRLIMRFSLGMPRPPHENCPMVLLLELLISYTVGGGIRNVNGAVSML